MHSFPFNVIPPYWNYESSPKDSLANIIKLLIDRHVLNDILLHRCIGITQVRNDSDHPPKSYEKRIKRHERLRTNLNNTLDLVSDLIEEKKQKGF